MKLIFIKDIAAHLGEEVTLRGWVRNIRHSGKLLFIILRDGTGEIQCVAFQPELGEEMFDAAKRLTMESSLIITGIPKPHQKLAGTFELSVKSVKPVQIAEEYPIGKKRTRTRFPALKPPSLDPLTQTVGCASHPPYSILCDL